MGDHSSFEPGRNFCNRHFENCSVSFFFCSTCFTVSLLVCHRRLRCDEIPMLNDANDKCIWFRRMSSRCVWFRNLLIERYGIKELRRRILRGRKMKRDTTRQCSCFAGTTHKTHKNIFARWAKERTNERSEKKVFIAKVLLHMLFHCLLLHLLHKKSEKWVIIERRRRVKKINGMCSVYLCQFK